MADLTDEQLKKADHIEEVIASGCSEVDFKKLQCPVCNSPLMFSVYPDMSVCAAMCSKHPFHIRRHILPHIQPPPAWWRGYIGGAWTD